MKNLLLLHGAIGSLEQLKPLAKELSKDYQVHTMNFSGHGGKAISMEPFSIKKFANDVLRWMDENKITGIDIVGYSMGGYVALYLAKHYSSRIGKIFTLATKFYWNLEIAEKESAMLIPEKITQKIPAFAEQLQKRHAPADWKTVLKKTADMMLAMGKENPLQADDFASIPNEVMISIGDKDKMVTLEETISVYRKIKNAQLAVFPATPHPIEQVDVFLISMIIKRFMN